MVWNTVSVRFLMEIEADAIRREIDRVLRSRTFENFEMHRRALSYLAEKSLAGEGDRLKEYIVALEAFGKPDTYDPRHDSYVRQQVGRLRQRLVEYYRTEGVEDPIVVQLPKGGFNVNFEWPHGTKRTEEGPASGWRRVAVGLAAALIAVMAWALYATTLMVRLRRQAEPAIEAWSPELDQLWAPFLESRRPLLVCMGTPLFARSPTFGYYRDSSANQWPQLEASEHFIVLRKALGNPEFVPRFIFAGAGDASAVFLIGKMLATRRSDILLTRSNLLSWEQISNSEVIFVGPPKFNVQLEELSKGRDIVIEAHGVRNLAPRPGEPVFLEDQFDQGAQQSGVTHAVISLVPGIQGRGDLLILGGNASADTFGAAQWLTQPWLAKELVSRLRLPSGKLPRYYQVVLKVQFQNGIPTQIAYLFHHTIKETGQSWSAKQ